MTVPALDVVVLISGGGSNLQALIDACQGDFPARIRAVFCNDPDAYGLQRARRAGIPTRVLDHRQYPDRRQFDRELQRSIEEYRPGLVALAGFMRILGDDFVQHFLGRMVNIHPSLLPLYPGLNTHRRVLDNGDREHGASLHFVTPELDAGPVILQARVPVAADDDPASLAARVLEKEHRIYPLVVRWFAEARLELDAGRIRMDGKILATPLQLDAL